MRLLVTGGAGYIGSVVTAQLLDAGHSVVVVDDLSTGHADAVPDGARLVVADVCDPEADLVGLLAGVDGVLHFAAKSLVAESVAHPERYWHTNVAGSLALVQAAREAGVARFVFSSTAATYGEPVEVPIAEDAPAAPTNPYGASKLAVDHMLASFSAAHGLGAVSLRYFNVGGARGGLGERHAVETHLIPIALQVASGEREVLEVYGDDYPTPDGTCIRDYLHVEDLARAHLLALEYAQPGHHDVVNLGTGTGFSVRQMVEAVRRVTGRDVPTRLAPRRPGDPAVLVAANDKARTALGWTPKNSDLDTIVRDAWEFVQRRG